MQAMARTLATKINDVTVDQDGFVFRHLVVNLREGDNIATFREGVDRWTTVQSATHTRVKRGDRVTLVSFDGLTIHDSYVVSKAQGGSVWLNDKPLRIISLEQDALFSDGVNEVVPKGTGYAVRHVRSKRDEGPVYTSAKAAEAEVLRRQAKVA